MTRILSFADGFTTNTTPTITQTIEVDTLVLPNQTENLPLTVNSSNEVVSRVLSSPKGLRNIGFSCSVAANALTIELVAADGSALSSTNPGFIDMWDLSSPEHGYSSTITITAAMSVTVGSGSTLGMTSGVGSWIYIYFINDIETPRQQIGVSRRSHREHVNLDGYSESDGSAADSATALYANIPGVAVDTSVKLIGRIYIEQATAGTWLSLPTASELYPFVVEDVVAVQAYDNAGDVIDTTNTDMIFTTEYTDTHGAYNNTTGVFTAPRDAYYTITWTITTASVAYAGANRLNTSCVMTLSTTTPTYLGNSYWGDGNGTAQPKVGGGTITIWMDEGNSFKIVSASTVATTSTTTGGNTYLSVISR